MNKNNRTTFIIGQTDSLEIAESISCLVSDHYWSRSEEVLRRQIAGLAAAGESCAALLCSAVILTHLKLFSHQWTTLQRALLFLLFHYFYFAVSSEIQKTQVHEYKLKQYLLTCSVHFLPHLTLFHHLRLLSSFEGHNQSVMSSLTYGSIRPSIVSRM